MKTITIYADPGHAWAKVKKSELVKLGIADLISPYSYERGEYAYLEEDCDLSTYIQKLQFLTIPFTIKYNQGNKRSRIRGYNQYQAFNK